MAILFVTALGGTPAIANDASAQFQATVETLPAQRLTVTGIDHVGMNVPDVEKASSFFAELLGARVVSDMRPEGITNAWKEAFNWHRSSKIDRIVMMQLQDGSQIELFQYSGPEISRARPHEDDDAETHIALEATDIQRSIALLKSRGLRILNAPVSLPDGTRWFYFLTPWHAQLELVFAPRLK